MPVVIQPEDFARWLDCKTQEPREVADLFGPVAEDYFEAIPVSDKVNKVVNTGPEIQDAVTPRSVANAQLKGKGKPTEPDGGQMSLF